MKGDEWKTLDFPNEYFFNFHLNDSVLTHLSSMGKSQWSLNLKKTREKRKKWAKLKMLKRMFQRADIFELKQIKD